MASVECGKCGKRLGWNAEVCRRCGEVQPKRSPPPPRDWNNVIGCVTLVLIVLIPCYWVGWCAIADRSERQSLAERDSRLAAQRLDSARRLASDMSLARAGALGDYELVQRFEYMSAQLPANQRAILDTLSPLVQAARARLRVAGAKARRGSILAAETTCASRSVARLDTALKRHTEWPNTVMRSILCARVSIGFTADQVRASWGVPAAINRTAVAGLAREQWVYGNSYVYIDNGIVTAVQN